MLLKERTTHCFLNSNVLSYLTKCHLIATGYDVVYYVVGSSLNKMSFMRCNSFPNYNSVGLNSCRAIVWTWMPPEVDCFPEEARLPKEGAHQGDGESLGMSLKCILLHTCAVRIGRSENWTWTLQFGKLVDPNLEDVAAFCFHGGGTGLLKEILSLTVH